MEKNWTVLCVLNLMCVFNNVWTCTVLYFLIYTLMYIFSFALQIPRNTRLMYVHSWQSLLWNKMLSWRIRELGRAPVMGDIVRKKSPRLPEHEDKRDSQTAGDGNEVEFVTEENICLYSIEDVLLPLPGWDVKLPQNQCENGSWQGGRKEGREREHD